MVNNNHLTQESYYLHFMKYLDLKLNRNDLRESRVFTIILLFCPTPTLTNKHSIKTRNHLETTMETFEYQIGNLLITQLR